MSGSFSPSRLEPDSRAESADRFSSEFAIGLFGTLKGLLTGNVAG